MPSLALVPLAVLSRSLACDGQKTASGTTARDPKRLNEALNFTIQPHWKQLFNIVAMWMSNLRQYLFLLEKSVEKCNPNTVYVVAWNLSTVLVLGLLFVCLWTRTAFFNIILLYIYCVLFAGGQTGATGRREEQSETCHVGVGRKVTQHCVERR